MRTFLVSAIFVCALPLAAQLAPAGEPGKTSFAISSDARKLEKGDPLFPTPAYFKRRFETPSTRVELRMPVRLNEYVTEGKLELSLKSYLDLVLANNPDVSVIRLQVETAQNAITRAASLFDPLLIARFNASRSSTPTDNTLAGAAVLSQLNQPLNINYTHTMETGTQLNFGFTGTKTSNNNAFQFLNPNLSSSLGFNVTQPLIRGFGRQVTRLPITIAQGRLRNAEFNFEDNLINLLVAAENAYWDVIAARENLRVQEEALKLNDTSLKRSQRELELGAISQLEIYQPQAQYANAEIFVTQARFRLAQAEDALRRQIGADIDESVRNMPIVLTESVTALAGPANFNREELVATAIRKRPDLRVARQNLDIDDLGIRSATNALRPDVSLTAGVTGLGRSGVFTRPITPGTPIPPAALLAGGINTALGQTFGFDYPTYTGGVVVRFPVRDRRAAADFADSLVAKKLDTYRLRAAEQNARLQVLNAINNVENSRASVELAKNARDLAQKRVEAEQKRYELGATTIFFVLAAQTDLTTAESNLVRETVNFRRNLLQLYQRTGQLLDERGIVVQ
jgi:outer membrane protein